jgi:hypothetical protein
LEFGEDLAADWLGAEELVGTEAKIGLICVDMEWGFVAIAWLQ